MTPEEKAEKIVIGRRRLQGEVFKESQEKLIEALTKRFKARLEAFQKEQAK